MPLQDLVAFYPSANKYLSRTHIPHMLSKCVVGALGTESTSGKQKSPALFPWILKVKGCVMPHGTSQDIPFAIKGDIKIKIKILSMNRITDSQ